MPLARKKHKTYTYADYLKWDDPTARVELIDGVVYDMTPAPSPEHQRIQAALTAVFENFLEGKKCTMYPAPFDVRLPEKGFDDNQITTVVQPDITIICDKKKIDDRGCIGSPDVVIEIISPATGAKDMREKLILYEKHGVKEYWIVHPYEKTVMVYHLNEKGEYSKPSIFAPSEKIKVKSLKGLIVDLKKVFAG